MTTNENKSLRLEIRTGFNISSFKNHKKFWQGRMMTDPKHQAKMEQIIQDIACQLRGMFPTEEGAMRGVCPKQWQTVSFPLFDDSLDWMIPGNQYVNYVQKGMEGCIVTLERIE